MSTESDRRIHELEQEFRECRDTVGNRMLVMEKESIEKLTRLETQMAAIAASLSTFVHQHQFAPVKLIAYGLAGGVLTTFLGAVLAKLLGIIS
jgi:hypothetical protein